MYCVIFGVSSIASGLGQPHIIYIVADDLGWNDVGYHGSDQIPTPNIDALAYNGLILNSHYVQASSTPSRTALFTGKYPIKLGMQGPSFIPSEPRALPLTKILPEYLKDLGYATHLVGKWDMGYSRWNETPTARGFDSHLGYYTNFISYYDYLNTLTVDDVPYTGFDLRRDTAPAWDLQGKYATDVFTEHAVSLVKKHDDSKPLFLMVAHVAPHAANDGKLLEAPQDTIDKFRHIIDSNRRTYAAMVSKLDDSVGALIEALQEKQMLDNSIVVFISDNGAPTLGAYRNWGSNYPLRGTKHTLFEGGVRGVALVWSSLIHQRPRVSNELMHITDWLPTLYSAAGGDITGLDPEIDGIDQWPTFAYDLPSARNDVLLNIDESTRNAALRFYNWKLIVGTTYNGTYNKYFGESGKVNIRDIGYDYEAVHNSLAGISIGKTTYPTPMEVYEQFREQATLRCLHDSTKKNPCDPSDAGTVCLYDIPNDPCEENDLSNYFPSVVRRMKRALVDYRSGLVEQQNKEPDIHSADPKFFNYTWSPWLDGCVSDSPCQA